MPGFPLIRTVAHCFRTISSVVVDLVRLAFFAVHSRRALAAENLFFRKLGFRWRGGCWGEPKSWLKSWPYTLTPSFPSRRILLHSGVLHVSLASFLLGTKRH